MTILNSILYGPENPMQTITNFLNEHNNVINLSELFEYLTEKGILYKYLFIQFFIFFCVIFYMIFFWPYKGATPGKFITKCKILDSKTYKVPSIGKCFLRFFGYIISTLLLCMGFFAIEFNKKKLGLHDLIAKTIVVKLGKPSAKKKRSLYTGFTPIKNLFMSMRRSK